ncbi:hypothetical protein H0H93_011954, partial [Arthromyces matolae]
LEAEHALLPGPTQVIDSWGTVSRAVGCGRVTGAAQVECMKKVPFDVLEKALIDAEFVMFAPVADARETLARSQAGNFLRVPLLLGSSQHEADVIVVAAKVTAGIAIQRLGYILSDMLTMFAFTCSVRSTALYRVKAGVPTWRYKYQGEFPNISLRPDLRAYHGAQLPIIFGTYPRPGTQNQEDLSRFVQKTFVAFARDPKFGLSLLKFGWPRYVPDTFSMAEIGGSLKPTGIKLANEPPPVGAMCKVIKDAMMIDMRPHRSLFLPLAFYYGYTAFATANILNNTTDTFINNLLSEWGSTGGLSVAFVQGDGQGNWTVETKGYGTATVNGSQVTENTLFNIGSNSKLFNILATGLLIDNATLSPRLSWNSKIAAVLPDWGLEDPIATKQASIVDLMSHRTGLPRHDYSYKWSDTVPIVHGCINMTKVHQIKKLHSQKPSTEFRQLWQYNNNMYTTLSYLPTALLKIPFARYVKQHIFDPLGLSSTTYSYDVAKQGHLADGFTRVNINYSESPFVGTPKPFPYWSTTGGEDGNNGLRKVLSGAGGVITNAVDMATWLQMLLLGGLKPGTNTSIIPTDVIQTVEVGISVANPGLVPFPELAPSVYGGGQAASAYRGHPTFEHDGSVPGFNSEVTRLPFDNIGVAVLTNDNDYGSFISIVVKYYLLDIALGLEPVDWNSRVKQLIPSAIPLPPPKRPSNATLPSVPLPTLAGLYNNDGYGVNEICYVSAPYPAQSKNCEALNANLSTILPGAVDPGVPTLIASWDSPWASHVRLSHFDGNSFNVSALISVPNVGNATGTYWTYSSGYGPYAEFVVSGDKIGLALQYGIWGAGAGVPEPQGPMPADRAEVWFVKV